MARYMTSLDINAPAGRVWRILTSFDRYREWNPQIPSAAGKPEEGTRITLRLALPGRPAMDLDATIEQVKVDQFLSWRGHLLAPWFFEGYREFAIQEAGPNRVSVTHVEDVHGLFAPLFLLIMGGPIIRSQQALNEALRARAEGSETT
ncbi:MAG: SRPBCC family protein [Vicinamibacterales bacterium]